MLLICQEALGGMASVYNIFAMMIGWAVPPPGYSVV